MLRISLGGKEGEQKEKEAMGKEEVVKEGSRYPSDKKMSTRARRRKEGKGERGRGGRRGEGGRRGAGKSYPSDKKNVNKKRAPPRCP